MPEKINRALENLRAKKAELLAAPIEALRGPAPLEALAPLLDQARGAVRDAFEDGRIKADRVMRSQTAIADITVQTVLDIADQRLFPNPNPTTGSRLAVIAVGGYGRREMAPYSDVDLLFLHGYKPTPHVETMAEHAPMRLWDLGFKPSNALRSVDECLRRAREDVTIETTLLERRFVWGAKELYDELDRKLEAEREGRALAFLEAKLEEREARHARTGDSRYLLEPNVKEGKGGLRDLHSLMWIGAFVYGARGLEAMVGAGALDLAAAKRFKGALKFLATVRCHLHYLAGRAEETLAFDRQAALAERMRYADDRGVSPVQRFMKRYYLVAKDVGDITRILLAALEDRHQRRPGSRLARGLASLGVGVRRVDGFVLQGGRVDIEDEDAFAREPRKMLALFHLAQQRRMDLHPRALRAVAENVKRVRADLRKDPDANRLFLEILTHDGDVATALRRMNETGLLGRFVPEFGRVIAMPQRSLYHSYTVDEHTLRALWVLRRIERGEVAQELPVSTREMPKVASRRTLFVAVFLHDVGKGSERDHSIKGAEIAQKLCPRLGLDKGETETVVWLVRNHLVMSDTAFKRDLEDPKTIADFVGLVQSPERLRLLLVLTVADIRAVGPKVWNGWKGRLLRELYLASAEAMRVGSPLEARANMIERKMAEVASRLTAAGWGLERVVPYMERHDRGYWLGFAIDDLVRHAQVVGEAEAAGQLQAADFRTDEFFDRTELVLFTQDKKGVFTRVAGALAVAGVSIVDAHIHTTSDGKVLNIYGFQEPVGRSAVTDKRQLARIKMAVGRAIAEEEDFAPALKGRRSLSARAEKAFPVAPRVMIDNAASRASTVIEVNGRDRPGLLYGLGQALTREGAEIASAHVATYGERAVDVFYCRDAGGRKLIARAKTERIERALLAVLNAR